MATKAFQKIYTKITQITKATCSLKATGVGYDELATVNGKLAQVVKIAGDEVTLQVFEGTEGIPTNAEVVFLGKAPTIKVSEQLARSEEHTSELQSQFRYLVCRLLLEKKKEKQDRMWTLNDATVEGRT